MNCWNLMWLIFASQAFGLYCNHFGAAKNQSFWNRPNCGKSQPIRTKFGTHLYSVAYHHFPNLCAGLFGGKWGIARTSAAEAEVFLVTKTRWLFGNLPAADFHQIWPRNVNPYPIDEFWFGFFFENFQFNFRVISSPKPQLKGVKHAPSTQTSLQPTHCRDSLLLTSRCNPRPFRGRSTSVSESKFSDFRILHF